MSALSELKELYLQENRRKYPSLPEAVRSVPKYTDKTSNGLTKMVIEWIRLNGWQAERITCTGRIIDKRKSYIDVVGLRKTIGSKKWIPSSMQPGTADVSATIAGRSVKIEIKCATTKDKQRPAQKEYQQQIEQAGGTYVTANTFEQFANWYREFINDNTHN
jgi:hypothetical protein